MRYPHTYFLKFLVFKKDDIQKVCEEFNLPVPTKSFVKELEKTKLPENFKAEEDDKISVEFLRQEGIYNLYFPDKSTKDAFSILAMLEAKDAIQKLIISREESSRIAKTVNNKYKTKLSAEAIDRYRHYFWNPEIMKLEDWVELYQGYERTQIRHIYNNGPDYAKHVLGFIQTIQIKESLKELAASLHFDMQALKFAEADNYKVKALADIANTLIKIDEKLNTSQDTIKKELENFERIQLQHADTNIKGILDVAKVGNYQGSGIELQEVFQKGKVIDYEEV